MKNDRVRSRNRIIVNWNRCFDCVKWINLFRKKNHRHYSLFFLMILCTHIAIFVFQHSEVGCRLCALTQKLTNCCQRFMTFLWFCCCSSLANQRRLERLFNTVASFICSNRVFFFSEAENIVVCLNQIVFCGEKLKDCVKNEWRRNAGDRISFFCIQYSTRGMYIHLILVEINLFVKKRPSTHCKHFLFLDIVV